ncbi:LOW QUALITY PROTEIN: hypothetical protein PanWU01x14_076980 [Parasponia andersonii]|uniref:Uncharacterized protein n=1 Tax=Parasponia andersonii TaxID=3476 RepID=A0A2P5DCG9_PARAD|nr:LOW QUALITY PROTEIN: hypothetical protein PanWU01x14_076980 [Parasponia andersonii]
MITGCSDISCIRVLANSSSLINKEKDMVVALLVAVVIKLRSMGTMSFKHLQRPCISIGWEIRKRK